MANALYRKLPDGSWMNQANGGGPVMFKVQKANEDGLYYAFFTYNGADWFRHANPQATPAAMQTALDNYVAQLNAGTA